MSEAVALDAVQQKKADEAAANLVRYRRSIRTYIKETWKLEPQPVKPEYAARWAEVCAATGDDWEFQKTQVSARWFGDPVVEDRPDLDWKWYTSTGTITSREEFVKRGYYSWQQNLVLVGVEKAVAGEAKRLLSIVSGHGIGKSATCSWIVLWFLYCFMDAQVPVTAPTSHQMHDVLWKEMSIWISRMPDEMRSMYEWTSEYVRIVYNPEAWFARARTSTKENTEAIAGVHGDHVAIVADEASGVPNQVFATAEGAMTGGNVLAILISNGTQTTGYFFDTHHTLRYLWQNFAFNGEESPLVDRAYIALKMRHGKDSEEYKIRVKGGFPGEEQMDLSGYLQLMPPSKVNVRVKSSIEIPFVGRKILGVDPAGEGKDKATFVLRDRFKMEKVAEMSTSNDKEIAERILTLIDEYKLHPSDVVVGAFGTGADVGKEVAIATAKEKNGPYEIYTVMEGNTPEKEERHNPQFFQRLPDEIENPYNEAIRVEQLRPEDVQLDPYDLYLNIRALMYFRMRKWLIAGGAIVDTSVDNSPFVREILVLRYKRTLHGNRIQLISKKELLKLGVQSPNIADAGALTFLRNLDEQRQTKEELDRINDEQNAMTEEERHSAI